MTNFEWNGFNDTLALGDVSSRSGVDTREPSGLSAMASTPPWCALRVLSVTNLLLGLLRGLSLDSPKKGSFDRLANRSLQ
jgi:hypothetical protein